MSQARKLPVQCMLGAASESSPLEETKHATKKCPKGTVVLICHLIGPSLGQKAPQLHAHIFFFSLISFFPKEDEKRRKRENQMHLERLRALLIITFIVLMFRFTVSENREGTNISWNYFVNEMLAKGEVQRIEVVPESDIVEIYLHPGGTPHGQVVSDLLQLE